MTKPQIKRLEERKEELYERSQNLLHKVVNMTSEEFRNGAEQKERQLLNNTLVYIKIGYKEPE